ncbi:MAG: hypothetical protein K0M70_01535 [Arenimonas sp.]|uniref:hypothetical protein n=1 Tax=Arenimonas sp. TaxID=1872635 RepID=UPI0025C007C8|nr:hypothetical protein [Arenimonas sp.]MBW8366531.1 hypothetical protein [Arenimonas sp.]
MATVQFRLTASEGDVADLINRVSALKGIDSVEEIADLMPHMDDPDSSSAGLSDNEGPGTHLVVVHADDEDDLLHALDVARDSARASGMVLEVEER